MASTDNECARLLASQTSTQIAQLHPGLPDQVSRVIRGEVTITWPYNRVKNTFAFLLAESDVLLRRAKGQVRIELHGAAAKAVADVGIGGGDEVTFSLDGVEWAKDESPGRIPGARVDWQLQFAEKLALQVKLAESGDLKSIHIDHPEPEAAPAVVDEQQPLVDEPATPAPQTTTVSREVTDLALGEYHSPAFIKRARISYGALFEGGFDIFEEDGGVKGKGRKRSRFGRDSSAWRYSSQSPSPEPSSSAQDAMEEDLVDETRPSGSPKPQMQDEGSQTVEIDMASPSSEVVRETITAPAPVPEQTTSSAPREKAALSTNPYAKPISSSGLSGPPTNQFSHPAGVGADMTEASVPVPNTLFGASKPLHSTFSMFGTTTPVRAESGFSLADQVRFEFSHIPRTAQAATPIHPHPIQPHEIQRNSKYPEAYLDASGPAKYADMSSYLGVAEDHPEAEPVHSNDMIPEPPAVEEFERGHWDMMAQSPHYNQIEGGHFGTDALNEGTRVTKGIEALHSDVVSPEKTPGGFSSYGGHVDGPAMEPDAEELRSQNLPRQRQRDEDGLVHNEETFDISREEVAVEDEDDAEYGEDGEVLEKGDYDQRNYNIPTDDDEGMSDEDDEIEEEAGDRYGREDIYDMEEEDGYGEQWEEDEEDAYDEDEESEADDDHWQGVPPRPQQQSSTAAPVVISLLSDSEDDDEPAPAPIKAPMVGNPKQQDPAPRPYSAETRLHAEAKVSEPTAPSASAVAPVESSAQEFKAEASPSGDRVQVVDFAAPPGNDDQEYLGADTAKEGEANISDSGSDGDLGNLESDVDVASDYESGSEHGSEHGDVEDEHSKDGLFVRQDADLSSDEQDDDISDEGELSSSYGDADGDGFSSDKIQRQDTLRDEIEVEEVEGEESLSEDIDTNDARKLDDNLMEVDSRQQVTENEDEPKDVLDVSSTSEMPTKTVSQGADAVDEDVEMANAVPSTMETITEHRTVSQGLIREPTAGPTSVPPDGPASEDSAAMLEMPAAIAAEDGAIEADQEPTPISVAQHRETADNELPQPGKIGMSSYTMNGSTALPSSPPMTQSFESHIPSNNLPHPASPATSRPMSKEGAPIRQLPTPMESFLTNDMVSQTAMAEEYEMMEISTPTGTDTQQYIAHSVSEVEASFESVSRPDVEEQDKQAARHSSLKVTKEIGNAEPSTNSLDPMAETQPQGNGYIDESHADDDATILSASASVDTRAAEEAADEEASPHHKTRSTRKRRQALEEDVEDNITVQTRRTRSHDAHALQKQADRSSPDLNITLARQAVAAKRPKKAPAPLRTSPMVTRTRSSSLQMSATPEVEDASINLARAALASPSKTRTAADGSTASLKSELTKGLRSLRECISLKSLRTHLDEHPNIVGIVTTQPPPPVRAKGGPREYMMSFHITDASTAPTQVIEVQLYRPHKESLPVVKPGDAILLYKFQVKALSNKGFGLRSHSESAWAVFDHDDGPPQVKGPPVEDWEQYSDYMSLLRTWYRWMDEPAKAKLDKANKKFEDIRQGK